MSVVAIAARRNFFIADLKFRCESVRYRITAGLSRLFLVMAQTTYAVAAIRTYLRYCGSHTASFLSLLFHLATVATITVNHIRSSFKDSSIVSQSAMLRRSSARISRQLDWKA